MRTKLLLLLITFILINFVLAQSFCVDFDPPSAPSNLILIVSGNDIQLSWTPATDEPACSGISHYDIYRNSVFLTSVNGTNYLDTGLSYGIYTYTIYPWDLAGHEGTGISNSITISASGENGDNGNGNGGGGGGSSDISYWECGKWSECINKTQERVCEDIFGTKPNRTETRGCFPSFTPFEQGNETENITGMTQTTNFLTGAVTGIGNFAKSGAGALTLSVLVLTGAAVVTVLLRKKIGKKMFKESEAESAETL